MRRPTLAVHTLLLLHHNELSVRGMIDSDPRFRRKRKGLCEEEEGQKVTPGFSLLFFPSRDKREAGREGGTTDVLPSFRALLV